MVSVEMEEEETEKKLSPPEWAFFECGLARNMSQYY